MTINYKLKVNWSIIVFLFLFFLISIVWYLTPLIISYWTKLDFNCYQERGAFGDSFGIITSMFSSLTFFLVLYGIYFQRKEIKSQEEMLEISRRQHYFDRAYEFLLKNIQELNQSELKFVNSLQIHGINDVLGDWEILQIADLNNTNKNTIELNRGILSSINKLKEFSNQVLPNFVIYFSDLDRLLKKLLGSESLNKDDYNCLMEIIKLKIDKKIRITLITALKFYEVYFSSSLSQQVTRIKLEGNSHIDLEPHSKSHYYNLLAIRKWSGIFL